MFLKFSHRNYPEACETPTPWAQPAVDDSLGLGWGPNCIPNEVSAVAAAILGTPFWNRGLLKDLDAGNLEGRRPKGLFVTSRWEQSHNCFGLFPIPGLLFSFKDTVKLLRVTHQVEQVTPHHDIVS